MCMVWGLQLQFQLCSCPLMLDFAPHLMEIVLEAKALGLPHVLRFVVWGKQEHAMCEKMSAPTIFFIMPVKICGVDGTLTRYI